LDGCTIQFGTLRKGPGKIRTRLRYINVTTHHQCRRTNNQTCIYATKIYSFLRCPIANLPWKFHANPFCQSCKVVNRHTDRQTDKQQRLHIVLGGGSKGELPRSWRTIL